MAQRGSSAFGGDRCRCPRTLLTGRDGLTLRGALQTAFEEAFGKKTVLMREGGSIPVAVDFQEAVGAPLMISGIGQADAAVHSPNEHLLISQYHTGIEALIRFMCRFAESGTA